MTSFARSRQGSDLRGNSFVEDIDTPGHTRLYLNFEIQASQVGDAIATAFQPLQLEAGQPALGGESHELGVRSHAGLGLDEIVIVLNGLDADVEICSDLLRRRAGSQLP